MSNKDIILRHHQEVWSDGNVDAVEQFYAPTFIGHHPGGPDWIGPEQVREVARCTRQAFPDFRETVEDVIAEGDKVVTRFTSHGTHLGPLHGFGPTGRSIAMSEIGIFRLAHGRIVEKWGELDRLGMHRQLGTNPLEPAASFSMKSPCRSNRRRMSARTPSNATTPKVATLGCQDGQARLSVI